MNRKIALLPLDSRPYTYSTPKQIAQIANWDLQLPSKEHLGFMKRPGHIESLTKWIEHIQDDVEGFVISIDTLVYGGLMPSRVNEDALAVLQERVSFIRNLKQMTNKKVFAFSTTMRISNSYVNEQEKIYWSEYGKEIWKYSYYSHKHEVTQDAEAQQIVEQMLKKIPEHILNDYLETRERNFQINLNLLDDIENGMIDFLVFPQDDTATYGLNIREQLKLMEEVSKRKLHSKVYIYPGADEVATTLVARMILELEENHSLAIYPFFSGEFGALQPAMYEDRPIVESVKSQIYAVGGITVESSQEADLSLAVHVPGKYQGDLKLKERMSEVDTGDRNIGEWTARIKHYLKQGKKIAVADVAYANGSDIAMMPRLLDESIFDQLYGFAGWNTAGNTLGTVIPQAAMVYIAEKKGLHCKDNLMKTHYNHLMLRLLSDYLYLTITRDELQVLLDENKLEDNLEQKVRDVFIGKCAEFKEEYPALLNDFEWQVTRIRSPLNRIFEVELDLEITKK